MISKRQSSPEPRNFYPGIKFDEIFCLRFPEIAESIFENVDNQSLVNCLEASRELENFLRSQSQKLYLKRKIQKIVESHEWIMSGMWKTVLKNSSTETIIQLEFAVSKFYGDIWFPLRCTIYQLCNIIGVELVPNYPDWPICLSPLHIAAGTGDAQLWKKLSEKCDEKNPKNKLGSTPLHFAALKGHLNVCKTIVEYSGQADSGAQNSKDRDDRTPLHWAAKGGHLSVCQFLMQHLKNKNPGGWCNETPLHFAAMHGYLSICEAILEYAEDKNPREYNAYTPLHLAAQNGHLAVCKLLMRSAEDKNPVDSEGMTPLDIAATRGHRHIIEFIMIYLDDLGI